MTARTLAGKTALVTGSTSGIGLGIAKALAQQGANIVLNGFGDAEGPKAEVAALGVKVAYHGADMSKAADIEAMMQFATDTFGGIDILVNNAGIQHVATVEDFPVDRWDAIIAINLTSAFHTTRLALPHMKKTNWGRIINVASVHGRYVDDASPVGLFHVRQSQACGVKCAGEVDRNNGVPTVHGEVFHCGDVLNACVIHQNIDAAKSVGGKLHHGFNVSGFAHVSAVIRHFDAQCCHFGFWAFSVTKAIQNNVGTLLRQGFGNAQADTAGGTCDQSGFAGQCACCHVSTPRSIRMRNQ